MLNLKSLSVFLILLLSETVHSQTIRINNFSDLMLALNSGEQVRAVMHYSQCKWDTALQSQGAIPEATASIVIDTWEYFARGAIRNKMAFVVFSKSALIENPIGKGFVYNYGKVRINEDNSVIVSAKYIHPKSLRTLMDESFRCTIHSGENAGGVDLFKQEKQTGN